jgi:hypothetical protein
MSTIERDKAKLRPQEELYTACEHYDFTFTQYELDRFRKLWKNGDHIADMADKLRRRPAEIAFLIIDQADLGKIGKRIGAAYGQPKKFTPGVRAMFEAVV